jgi:hypothetical protein
MQKPIPMLTCGVARPGGITDEKDYMPAMLEI